MPRNGSGTFSAPINAWNPALNGVSATAADWQALLNDLVSAMTQSISADGQTPITGNLAMGGNKLTGLGAGVATGQSLRFEQLFDQGIEADLASATTTDIGAQNTNFLQVTGTTTITSFGTTYKGPRFIRFSGVLTLTHNAATLILPGGASITTAAGDMAIATPVATTGTPTGWKVAVYQRANGLPVSTAGFALSGANNDITSLTGLTSPIPRANTISIIQSLPDPTLAANAMTLPASTHALDFRSATLTTGIPATVTGTAAALVIPAGATLGAVNAIQSTLVEVILNNAGTLEKAVVNLAGGNDLSESGVISTTAISAGATAANVFYSTTARSNVAYRVVRAIASTQATAGQWATSPTLVQGAGGNALTAMSSLGYGQTWQNLTGSRALATTYYNTTGKPIFIYVGINGAGNTQLIINGVTSGTGFYSITGVIPPGASYSVTSASAMFGWSELR